MAESNPIEELKQENPPALTAFADSSIKDTNVMTGDSTPNTQLYYQLKRGIQNASGIDIIVSFLMESGVKMLLKDLQNAIDRGVKIRLLTGNYLVILSLFCIDLSHNLIPFVLTYHIISSLL